MIPAALVVYASVSQKVFPQEVIIKTIILRKLGRTDTKHRVGEEVHMGPYILAVQGCRDPLYCLSA